MTLEELLARIASEPDRAEERTVKVAGAALRAQLERQGGMLLGDFLKHPDRRAELRTLRHGHRVGTGVSSEDLAAWRKAWPDHPLPADLEELLQRANGIHLWADLETGRAYHGLAPLSEWDLARRTMYGADAAHDLLDDRYLALSYHADGAAFVVLNVENGRYFLMDAAGPDESCPIGASVGELLDWLWNQRV